LIAAALSTSWAESSIRQRRWAGLRLGLTATIVLGVVFSLVQAFELSRIGFSIHDGTYGATFFTLTIFHALHVVVGVLWAGIVLARATRGYVAPEQPFAVQATVLYWYFIAVAWVIMFAVLYFW
ncbi:MAG TPA: cytochrome c oxidase subunit 3, partial [Chloroflexi bacterium]|nr:cytochrome c oxidase subunit 3 [Chloroflexota bacterium]